MGIGQEIAKEVGLYLQVHPSGTSSSVRGGAGLEPPQADRRGLGESARGIGGWVWRRVEPLVKQQICTEENYARLNSITDDQLAMHIDDILAPLVISVTDRLPALLKFLVPLLSSLRKQIAAIIAQELQRARVTGWSTYCGRPPQT
jgi:hypothetical protein